MNLKGVRNGVQSKQMTVYFVAYTSPYKLATENN